MALHSMLGWWLCGQQSYTVYPWLNVWIQQVEVFIAQVLQIGHGVKWVHTLIAVQHSLVMKEFAVYLSAIHGLQIETLE